MPSLNEVVTGAVAGSVRAGVGWWLGELRGLLPAGALPGRTPSQRASIRPLPGSVEIERVAEGMGERYAAPAPIEALDDESWAELEALIYGGGAQIVLTHPDLFSMTVALPRAARTRLRSAVALQMSELAPVDPALLMWTVHDTRRDGDRVQVRVTMAHRRRIEGLGRLFEARGIPAPPIVGQVGERVVPLAAGFRGAGKAAWSRTQQRWLLIIALVLAAPLLTLVGAWVLTAHNEEAIAMLEATVGPRLESDRRARQAERVRRALAPLYAYAPASAIVEDLAQRLPDSAHAVELARGPDGSLQLSIETADPDLVRPRLAGDRLLPNLREVAQTRTDQGSLRVVYVAVP